MIRRCQAAKACHDTYATSDTSRHVSCRLPLRLIAAAFTLSSAHFSRYLIVDAATRCFDDDGRRRIFLIFAAGFDARFQMMIRRCFHTLADAAAAIIFSDDMLPRQRYAIAAAASCFAAFSLRLRHTPMITLYAAFSPRYATLRYYTRLKNTYNTNRTRHAPVIDIVMISRH